MRTGAKYPFPALLTDMRICSIFVAKSSILEEQYGESTEIESGAC
jgi:hypothetical protein